MVNSLFSFHGWPQNNKKKELWLCEWMHLQNALSAHIYSDMSNEAWTFVWIQSQLVLRRRQGIHWAQLVRVFSSICDLGRYPPLQAPSFWHLPPAIFQELGFASKSNLDPFGSSSIQYTQTRAWRLKVEPIILSETDPKLHLDSFYNPKPDYNLCPSKAAK